MYGNIICATLTVPFLVTDGYALSLRCENEFYELDVRHYPVSVAKNGSFCIDADSSNKTFSNITDLIRFYTGERAEVTTGMPVQYYHKSRLSCTLVHHPITPAFIHSEDLYSVPSRIRHRQRCRLVINIGGQKFREFRENIFSDNILKNN